MKHLALMATCLSLMLASVASADTIILEDGDVSGLRSAISQANIQSRTIQLAAKGRYLLDVEPLHVGANIRIEANQATLSGDGAQPLFVVGTTGTLALNDAIITKARRAVINRGVFHGRNIQFTQNTADERDAGAWKGLAGAVLVNRGKAVLEDAWLHHNTITFDAAKPGLGGSVVNFGDLKMARISFEGNMVQPSEWCMQTRHEESRSKHVAADLVNHASADLVNGQFLIKKGESRNCGPLLAPFFEWLQPVAISNARTGEMSIRNSVIPVVPEGYHSDYQWLLNAADATKVTFANSYFINVLQPNFTSVGGNVTQNISDELAWRMKVSKEDDAKLIGPFAIWSDAAWYVLANDSPLVGAGVNCPEKDARGVRRSGRCDVGAVQMTKNDWVKDTGTYSGSWTLDGAAHDKKGVLIESLPGERMQIFMFDYQYKYSGDVDGQRWRTASGLVHDGVFHHKLLDFGGNGFATKLQWSGVGSYGSTDVYLVFVDCMTGLMSVEGKPYVLRRLTLPSGVTGCGQPEKESLFSRKKVIDSGISGSWYPPSHAGQGFFVEVLPDQTVQAFYFGFGSKGYDRYTIGNGNIDGNIVRLKSYYTQLNSDETKTLKNWGTMTLKFNSCNDAEVWFDGVDGKDYLKLKRLTSWAGNECQ